MKSGSFSRVVLSVVLIFALFAGCAHLPQYALPGPSPSPIASPSVGPSASPGPCGTAAANATAFIVISVTVLPSTAPSFGPINGYVEANSDGTFGLTASVPTLHASDVVQFANVDDYGGTVAIYHSAVGFPSGSFPATPYTFPGSTQVPLGTVISSAQWSTGRLGTLGAICYSQTFTLSAGTYYFGDYDFYNSLDSLRGVLVVQSGSRAQARHAMPILLMH